MKKYVISSSRYKTLSEAREWITFFKKNGTLKKGTQIVETTERSFPLEDPFKKMNKG